LLSSKTITVIKSTVPVLQEHGQAITTRFYEMLFSNHPELLNIFNHVNQKQGRQQTALANAIYSAAANIEKLETILPVVKQIAHKHRSLGVKAEHYPIVGEHLLLAIKEVLGEAATDEIIEAWAEAYNVIADVFISVENEMYQQAEQEAGGWAEFRKFVVDKKVEESDVITSFYLKPEDGHALASFKPGQYISIKMKIDGEKFEHIRQYSLSDSPGKPYYRISVKREDGNEDKADGIISTYLHNHIQAGDILKVSAPAGDFILDTNENAPVVLLSGGVGLTPMVSMLNTIIETQPDRQVTFIHAAINSSYHAMRQDISDAVDQYKNVTSYVCYESPTDDDRDQCNFDKEGYIDLQWLKSIFPDNNDTDFYFCGPIPFMRAINRALKEWGVSEEQIHFEFFGPKTDLEEPTLKAI
jgi:nitric oxide dioxygenase